MELTSAPRAAHLAELDGLRGLLALWVAIAHIFCWCGFVTAALESPGIAGRLARGLLYAEPAVETFIILSGFVIALYLDTRRPSYRAFMTNRFFRIYPVYAACLVAGIAASRLAPIVLANVSWHDNIYLRYLAPMFEEERNHLGLHAILHATLLNGMVPAQLLRTTTATILAPGWSLSLEWQFYLVAPLVVRWLRTGVGILALGMAVWLGLRYSSVFENPHMAFLPPRLPLFLAGIASYVAYARAGTERGVALSAYPAAILVLAALSFQHVMTMGIWAVSFGAVLSGRWSAERGAESSDPLGRVFRVASEALRHPWLRWLGAISYPLYLVHWPILIGLLYAMLRVAPAIPPGGAAIALGCVGLPCMLATAWALHEYVELPGMRWGKALASRPARPADRVLAE